MGLTNLERTMDGDQQRIYDGLKKVMEKLEAGYYGTGDDVDYLSLQKDLDEFA